MNSPKTSWIRNLQKNRIFKFASSVRLAVPVMLFIAIVVAIGTVIESQYNTQVARILVYHTWWFNCLLALLWINIFSAAVSRYPYKEHHVGFVITHVGLLTMLIGAAITATLGIDGSLRVIEGQSSNTVVLGDLVLKTATPGASTALQTFHINRTLSPQNGESLGVSKVGELTGIRVGQYLPLVTVEQTLAPPTGDAIDPNAPVALSFNIQSQFFNVSETLNSDSHPEMQMGPAHLKLIKDSARPPKRGSQRQGKKSSAALETPQRKTASAATGTAKLVIKDAKSGAVLQTVAISKLQGHPITVQGTKVNLVRAYQNAVVAANKLAEKGDGSTGNPALELRVEKNGQAVREISFAKFPDFALNAQGSFGLKFVLEASSGVAEAPAASSEASSGSSAPAGNIPMHGQAEQGATSTADSSGSGSTSAPAGNQIEFHVLGTDTSKVKVVLVKNGAQVLSQIVKTGDVLQTPWMGMKVTVNSVGAAGAMRETVKPAEMQPKLALPPSAIFVTSDLPGTEGTWIVEGDAKRVQTSRGVFDIYYGPDTVDLPFNVQLEQFRKIDYPGTEMALSFESTIHLDGEGTGRVIQMNEPLQHQGYLLYQSSYEMGQGQPTASIFSVNKDPGRWIKYIGAIILIIGIALFTIMRSKWYMARRKSKTIQPSTSPAMTTALFAWLAAGSLFFGVSSFHANSARADISDGFKDFTPEAAQTSLKDFASQIDTSLIQELPVQNRGRIKPLDSFARETILFLSGKTSIWGLNPNQLLLGLTVSDATPYVQIINVRDPELRTKLGFQKSERWFTLQQLENSSLKTLAAPILEKQQKNEKLVTPDDKKILEVVQQIFLLRSILSQQLLTDAVILDLRSDGQNASSAGLVVDKLRQYLGKLQAKDYLGANLSSMELISLSKSQSMPELFRPSLDKLHTEVLFYRIRPFFWAGMLYILIGIALVSGLLVEKLTVGRVFAALGLPTLLHAGGFGIRVYITGFAPVTNMYGTMVWMAFGVAFFGAILYALYRNKMVYGLLLIGSGAVLLLTESIPLILSPDMDPIVAVLRNNFWLTIHVLTISISYAAFTIAMLIGNAALIQAALGKGTAEGYKTLSHLAYRAIQLGVFLLTTGIILGGWWADYSWGRFWGWDPKETWALIADLGFLAIMHAKYVGWLDAFGVLAAAPMSYLLVIMAWYGVNFILAAGLHSYGFSSGGATIVVTFVITQFIIFGAGMLLRKASKPEIATQP